MAKKKAVPAKQASGGARLKASGKLPALLGLTPEQVNLFDRAREKQGASLARTAFIIQAAVEKARKILKE